MANRTEPVERPILFSGTMIKAILENRKTQTRRIVKPQPTEPLRPMVSILKQEVHWCHTAPPEEQGPSRGVIEYSNGRTADLSALKVKSWKCPHGQPGDRLWVKETWARNYNQLSDDFVERSVVYAADGVRASENGTPLPWEPSIHMPRWASRITLEIQEVRVERLQDISIDDAIAEGVFCDFEPSDGHGFRSEARNLFRDLWDSMYADRAPWSSNPFVWAISFARLPEASDG